MPIHRNLFVEDNGNNRLLRFVKRVHWGATYALFGHRRDTTISVSPDHIPTSHATTSEDSGHAPSLTDILAHRLPWQPESQSYGQFNVVAQATAKSASGQVTPTHCHLHAMLARAFTKKKRPRLVPTLILSQTGRSTQLELTWTQTMALYTLRIPLWQQCPIACTTNLCVLTATISVNSL